MKVFIILTIITQLCLLDLSSGNQYGYGRPLLIRKATKRRGSGGSVSKGDDGIPLDKIVGPRTIEFVGRGGKKLKRRPLKIYDKDLSIPLLLSTRSELPPPSILFELNKKLLSDDYGKELGGGGGGGGGGSAGGGVSYDDDIGYDLGDIQGEDEQHLASDYGGALKGIEAMDKLGLLNGYGGGKRKKNKSRGKGYKKSRKSGKGKKNGSGGSGLGGIIKLPKNYDIYDSHSGPIPIFAEEYVENLKYGQVPDCDRYDKDDEKDEKEENDEYQQKFVIYAN